MAEFKFPSEMVDLPSKGLLYPEGSALASGTIEMKYMTAKEEDILTNQNYIRKGVVIDKLLKSLILTDINYEDLLIGDKDAILIASRILGYGKDYEVKIKGESHTIDCSTLENKEFDESKFKAGKNEFSYTLPSTDNVITYKLITGHDEKAINREIAGLKRLQKDASPELSTRLKHIILSVDGKEEKKDIRDFVDNYFLARDSRAFRDHIKNTQPDVNLSHILDNGEEAEVPIGLTFFWPDY